MKKKSKVREERCICPYCDEQVVAANFPFRRACGIVFYYCLKCQLTVLDREATNCPKCGEPLS